jgi:hypothetical protein
MMTRTRARSLLDRADRVVAGAAARRPRRAHVLARRAGAAAAAAPRRLERHDPDFYVEASAPSSSTPAAAAQLIAASARCTSATTRPPRSSSRSCRRPRRTSPRSHHRADRQAVGRPQAASFTGNVRAVRDAGRRSPARRRPDRHRDHRVPARRPDKELATTDKPVTIEEPRGIIRSVGLTLDNKAKTLKLASGVSGTFNPRPAAQAPSRSELRLVPLRSRRLRSRGSRTPRTADKASRSPSRPTAARSTTRRRPAC